jgi:hypothetical protein
MDEFFLNVNNIAICLHGGNYGIIGAWCVKICIETDHKYFYKLCMKHFSCGNKHGNSMKLWGYVWKI